MTQESDDPRLSALRFIKDHPIAITTTGLTVLVVGTFVAWDQTEKAAAALGLPTGSPLARGIVLAAATVVAFVCSWSLVSFAFREGRLLGHREEREKEAERRRTEEAQRADAIATAERRHDAIVKRLREDHAQELANYRKWYESNLAARLHVIVRGAVLGSQWEDLHVLRGHFELTIVSSAVWPQWVTVDSVVFQPQGGGEWFRTTCHDGQRRIEPGAEYVPTLQPRASEEDIDQLMRRGEMENVSQGGRYALVHGRLVVRLRALFDSSEMVETREVFAPTALRVGHTEADVRRWAERLRALRR